MDVQVVLKNKWTQTAAISMATCALGVGLTYIFTKRKWKRSLSETIDEIETNLDHMIPTLRAAKGFVIPIVVNDSDEEELDEEELLSQYSMEKVFPPEKRDANIDDDDDEDDEPEEVHIYTILDEDWDYDDEVSRRTPDAPYVIHTEEFMADELGYTQSTVTYYVRDDVMADTDDTPIYNYTAWMGELKFGHGSKDPSVVYIRNEKRESEWEVLLNPGSFLEEVQGIRLEEADEKELRHSVLKFRRE